MKGLKQNIGKHFFYIPALILFIFYIIIPACMQIYFGLIEWQGIRPLVYNFSFEHYIRIFEQLFGSKGGFFLNALKKY